MTTRTRKKVSPSATDKRHKRETDDSPCSGRLTAHFDGKPGTEIIFFQRPPAVLFEKGRLPDRRDVRPSYRQKDGSMVVITPLGRRAEAIWLFFCEGILRALVMIDDLPATLDSHEACQRVWPTEIKTNACGVVLWARLSNGSELQGGFDTAFAQFDPGLHRTGSFFEPLDQVRDAVSAKYERKIKAVADREYAKWHHKESSDTSAGVNGNNQDDQPGSKEHPDSLVRGNWFIRHWHKGKYQEHRLTPTERRLAVYCATHCRDKDVKLGGYLLKDLCPEKLGIGKEFASEKAYAPSHLFWKDRIRKGHGGFALFPLFFRQKRASEYRGVYDYIGPPLEGSTPPRT